MTVERESYIVFLRHPSGVQPVSVEAEKYKVDTDHITFWVGDKVVGLFTKSEVLGLKNDTRQPTRIEAQGK
ncbi:MAG: hypothetical protein JSU73_04970 [candidate division WOR-3 bacterium]|nr:MAG: hypothetical protein JSU73_04970 [candidate division WOR-3 bacterium]